jgi:hypothetical protein
LVVERFTFPSAVIVWAEKFPLPSRRTIALNVVASVAALASRAGRHVRRRDRPTVLTTVADCGPVTSPESG